MMTNTKIVFMGSPAFAVPALKALIEAADIDVVGVFSQPPKPAGRGHKETVTPIHALADDYGIPVFTPKRFREEAQAELKKLNPDVVCVAAYGLLLPEVVVNGYTCLNIHPSDLPRWRGANPLGFTVLEGDLKTALCIMHMDKGMDTGAVYLREYYDMPANITTGKLHDWMSKEGAKHLLEVVRHIETLEVVPQMEDGATYASKWSREDINMIRELDIRKLTAEKFCQRVRGLSPWPAAQMSIQGETVKILMAEPVKGEAKAGTVLSTDKENGFVVAAIEGGVRMLTLQRAGKKAVSATDFLNGFAVEVGDIV